MKKTATLLALSALTLAANAGTTTIVKSAPQPRMEASNPGFANVVFGSIDTREDSTYGYLGFLHALNCDLGQSGYFVRGSLGYGEYQYRNFGLLNPEVESDLFDADLGLGYKHVINSDWSTSVFAAAHYHNDDLSQSDPSDLSDNEGVGARFGADITGLTGPIWWNGIAQYSTMEDAIWARARVGYVFGKFTVGPEFTILNDGRFEEKRIGGFVKYQATEAIELSLSVGDSNYDAETDLFDGHSLYGTFGVSYSF